MIFSLVMTMTSCSLNWANKSNGSVGICLCIRRGHAYSSGINDHYTRVFPCLSTRLTHIAFKCTRTGRLYGFEFRPETASYGCDEQCITDITASE